MANSKSARVRAKILKELPVFNDHLFPHIAMRLRDIDIGVRK